MGENITVGHIRIVTRERPTDRFLTTQVRAATEGKEDSGDLYFLVEILNPWLANSQIGQTIINAALREYRRGESPSALTNFELALRKVNQTLAHITQSGETDWIGNLSALIVLVAGDHIHVAQTGSARAYLTRSGRVSDITEDVSDEDNPPHPLTTFTNITSGILESGDRVLLATSLLAEHFTAADLKPILNSPSLLSTGHDLIRALLKVRIKRAHLILLEANPKETPGTEILYLDQPLSDWPHRLRELLHRHVVPVLNQTGQQLNRTAQQTADWTRDWLIPKAIDWGKSGAKAVIKASDAVIKQAARQPAFKKLVNQPPASGKPNDDQPPSSLVGKTIYRVHHYETNRPQTLAGSLKRIFKKLTGGFTWLPKIRLTRRQLFLLGGALLVILIVAFSTTGRRTERVAEVKQSTASAALETAKAAQQAGERAFILGQKETAKSQFLEAITKAEIAQQNETSQAQAEKILSQSQAIFDQLILAKRLTDPKPIVTVTQPAGALGLLGDQILVAGSSGQQLLAFKAETGAPAATASLAIPVTSPVGRTVLTDGWYLTGSSQRLVRYTPANEGSVAVEVAGGSWEPAQALASFGTSLYLLDPKGGQIWRHRAQGEQFGPGQGFLKTADPEGLASAIDLAIDGDLYLLTSDGTVKKYTKGEQQKDWQVAGIPTPWKTILKPLGIVAHPDSQTIYILDAGSDSQPARIVELENTGAFKSQLILPSDWTVTAWHFDANKKAGLILAGKEIYKISFSE